MGWLHNNLVLLYDLVLHIYSTLINDFILTYSCLCLDGWSAGLLAAVAETIKNFAVIYLVDITEVPDFNTMYELYDPSTVMFFFRNKHIMIDLGTGNNNKINWALKDKQKSSLTSWRRSTGVPGRAVVWWSLPRTTPPSTVTKKDWHSLWLLLLLSKLLA